MDELSAAVNSGIISVRAYGGGFLVTGAVHDLFVQSALESAGAEWRESEKGYFVTDTETGDFKRLESRSKAAAAAVAARRARAQREGVRLFDNQRARQQKKITREIRGVYESALSEHGEELKAVTARLSAEADPKEAVKLAYRRDELASVIDELARGMANAGAAAAALTDTHLQGAAAISRNIASWQLDNMAGFRVSRFIAHDTASLAVTGIGTYHGKFDLKAWQGVSDRAHARKVIKQSISRGLLTGEHPEKIAERIQGLFTGDEPLSPHKRAVRIARTETAGVMNQALFETMKAADAGGLRMMKRWDATLDGDTRADHRKVDGETVPLDAKFSNGLMMPGDGGAADRINCRCCLTEVLEGFEPDAPIRRDNVTGKSIPYMTYSEWEKMNA